MTCTILNWLPLFTRKESVDILIQSFKYLQKEDNFKLYAYVILENHIHLIASSDDIAKSMKHFKSYTAKKILKLLKKENVLIILEQLGTREYSLLFLNTLTNRRPRNSNKSWFNNLRRLHQIQLQLELQTVHLFELLSGAHS